MIVRYVAGVVLALLVVNGAFAPRAAAGLLLAPHRAVYDIGLLRSEVGSGVTGASGRMVFEVTGGACDGYHMRQRMVVGISDEGGNLGLLDFRIATFESADGNMYNFDSTTFLNREVVETVGGEARRLGPDIQVRLSAPSEKTVLVDGGALFPSQHMQAIIDAAEKERNFLAVDVFEGAGSGETSDAAVASIGGAMEGGLDAPLLDGTRHWPVSVGYFDGLGGDVGEELPSYQLSYELYENGVTNDLVMDFGDYVLSGSLSEIEALTEANCS